MIALATGAAATRKFDTGATLMWHPIAAQPFFAAAREATEQRRTSLLREGVRRDPRAVEPRFTLIRELTLHGQMPAAVDQLAMLNRLDSPLTHQILSELAGQIDSAARARAIAETFGEHPELFIPILARLEQGPGKTTATALVRRLPPKAFDIPQVRTSAIGILVNGGEYRRAYALWSGSLAPAPPLRDPGFSGGTVPGPFSWQLGSGDAGTASWSADGLDLAAFGQQSGVLASQLLLLAPGRWRAMLRYQAIDRANGGLSLALRCKDSGRILASSDLIGSGGARHTVAIGAIVPTGHCAAQLLQIEAMPSDDLSAMHSRALSMHVARPAA